MAETRILVGHARFNIGTEYSWLAERDEDGAVGGSFGGQDL